MTSSMMSAFEPRAVTEASLLDAATRLAGAERWGNVAVLEELLAPEYRGYDVSGQMHNRTSFLLAYAKGKMRLAALRLSQLETKVMGEVGLVAGVSEMCTGLGVEKLDLRFRFLDVYTWSSGGWRLIASQDTPLPR